ncbi:MAG: tetratricopeptide repeat protein [Pseudonocardiaceae bacterium]
MSVAGERSDGPVAEFCAGLRRLQEESGLDRATLVRQVNCGSAQLNELLDGETSSPPDWDLIVKPLVRACTGDDEREVAYWGWRHDMLMETYGKFSQAGPGSTHGLSQLPADVDVFTGRAQELAELDCLLTRTGQTASGDRATAVVISAVSGTAGVGKTALALRWAHRVRAGFPDGQLYVNLRGYDPDQPMSAGDALAGFLRALGMPGQDTPQRPHWPDNARGCGLALRVAAELAATRSGTSLPDLIAPASPGRYGMHDLLRAYATHLAAEEERREALTRLFDHYLATAAAAMDALVPAEQGRRPRVPPPATPTPPVADPTAAQAWLDAERATLAATCFHTATHGWPVHTARLATTLFRYLDTSGHYPDALVIHTHALHAACRAGDTAAEAHALTNLGIVYWRQSRYQQAADHHQQALALFREIGHRDGESSTLNSLGIVYERQGRYERAADHLQQSLALAREIDDRSGEASALDTLGTVYRQQGRYEQAVDHHQQALALCREIGHRDGEASCLNGVGEARRAAGQLREAQLQYAAALALASEIGHCYEQARAQSGLAQTYHAIGNADMAHRHWRQAFTLYSDLGAPEAHDVRAQLTALDQAQHGNEEG